MKMEKFSKDNNILFMIIGSLVACIFIIGVMAYLNLSITIILSPFLGLVGFIGVYIVSVLTPQRNEEYQKINNTKTLMFHLHYTYKSLFEIKNDVNIKYLLFDEQWFSKITDSKFTLEERRILFDWFKRITVLAKENRVEKSVFPEVATIAFGQFDCTKMKPAQVKSCFEIHSDFIEKTIEKYKKKGYLEP